MLSPNLTENALLVLRKRILARDVAGKVCETPEEMFRRVAKSIASADLEYELTEDAVASEDEFFEVMTRLEFLPNSPALMNAGRDLSQLSACFVLPIDDSMESIFGTLADTALIQKSGGGTGFSFSRLRPKEDSIQTTHGQSSGPVSFIRLYNFATEVTKLGGKRAGANMAILRVDHPDIEEFIAAKSNPLELNTFNISVAITDEFMKRVGTGESYELINPRNGQIVGYVDARKVFNQIVESAWRNGEPGVIFIDRINRDNPTPDLGEIESTNPCGEQPLLPYESCVLGSINLSRFYRNGRIDYARLKEVVAIGIHFLDNIIDKSEFPIRQIKLKTAGNRKVGLGIMGWADLLIRLGIPYDSEEAITLAEELMMFIAREATSASIALAKSRGPFPRWNQETIYNNNQIPRRNATVTTVAPTGTISLIANCSSGIEPIYSVAYRRLSFESDRMLFVHPLFEQYARDTGFHSEPLMDRISETGSLHDFTEVPAAAKRLFVTTHDIAPEWHVRMQAAFQKHIDAAVSKTINFANSATVEDVKQAYQLSYSLGCKGITIYRDGSRENQVLSSRPSDLSEPASPAAVTQSEIEHIQNERLARNFCPDCESSLQHSGGCLYCSCGYSVCVQA
jgi:ribonucleoside-diphosphate reductase alpha chain